MNHFLTNPVGLESRIGLFTYWDMPELQQLSSDIAVSYNGLDIESCTSLTSISYPNLTDIDPLNIGFGYVWISDNAVLNTVNFPLLQHVSSDVTVNSCDSITAVAFPELLSTGGIVIFSANPLCVSVDLRKFTSCLGDLTFGVPPGPASDGSLTSVDLSAFQSCGGKLSVCKCNALPSFSAPELDDLGTGAFFLDLPAITNISLPKLTGIDPFMAVFGALEVKACPLLTTFFAPLLNIIPGHITIEFCDVLTNVSLPSLALSYGPIVIRNNPACTAIDFSALTTANTIFIGVTVGDPPNDGALTSVDFSLLSQALTIQIQQCNALTSVSFPQLPSCASGINISFNPALTSFSAPFWNPIGAQQVVFIENALDVTSINNILVQCAAAVPGFTGPVSLYGGTNAAPTGAGATAKATLISNGNAVVTN